MSIKKRHYQYYWEGMKMPKGRILVIDDEEDVREVLRLHLEGAGYNVLEAENGEVGISTLRSEDNMVNVGVILCDIRMPKVNGVECVDFLKREAPGVPVVMVTGYPDTEMATSFLKKGVKDYLVKPVEKEKLLSVVGKIVAAGKDIGL
jgi:two-component system chemotaxis response regulator CheY